MKKINKLWILVLGFVAGAGSVMFLHPATVGAEVLFLLLVLGLTCVGYYLGQEAKECKAHRAYEKGYCKGYERGMDDGTVEIHSHVDVYHFPEDMVK